MECISQTKYINDLLTKAFMQDHKKTDTPFSTGLKLERIIKNDLLSKVFMQNYKWTDTPFSTGLKLVRIAKGLLGQEFEDPHSIKALLKAFNV